MIICLPQVSVDVSNLYVKRAMNHEYRIASGQAGIPELTLMPESPKGLLVAKEMLNDPGEARFPKLLMPQLPNIFGCSSIPPTSKSQYINQIYNSKLKLAGDFLLNLKKFAGVCLIQLHRNNELAWVAPGNEPAGAGRRYE